MSARGAASIRHTSGRVGPASTAALGSVTCMAVSQTRRARAARRRARRVAAADNDLTLDEWASLVEAWGACAYCGAGDGSLQKDCVLPISRGGRYTFENVVPACRSCNASKSNDEVTRWLRRKRYDEAAFLLRYREVLVLVTP